MKKLLAMHLQALLQVLLASQEFSKPQSISSPPYSLNFHLRSSLYTRWAPGPGHATLAQHRSTPSALLLGNYLDWDCPSEGPSGPQLQNNDIAFTIIPRRYIPSGTMATSTIDWCSSTRESYILLVFKEKESLELLQHPISDHVLVLQ